MELAWTINVSSRRLENAGLREAIGEVTLPSVPASAIRSDKDAGTDRVFIVNNRVIEERLVQLGPKSEGFVSIRSGLSAGERIILAPSPELADGQRLR